MNDLISRQAAIEALGERPIVWNEWTDEYALGQRNQYDIDKLAIETVLPAQQWIPVTERLPKFDELVLVWVENKDPKGGFNKPGIHTAQLRDKKPEHDLEGKKNIWGIPGYDSEWTVWAWSYFSEPDVKAWMPLPEPYKEENDEQVQG